MECYQFLTPSFCFQKFRIAMEFTLWQTFSIEEIYPKFLSLLR